ATAQVDGTFELGICECHSPSGAFCTKLILSNLSISGFQNSSFIALPDLEELDLSHNTLGQIDLALLPANLKHLNLSAVGIAELSFGDSTLRSSSELEVVDVSYNALADVDVGLVPHSLLSLNASHNRISMIWPGAMSPFVALERMNLSSNALTTVDLSVFPQSIRWLDISNNSMTE
ncbi:hypothetical protein, variant, partial [Sphaeroforma arctica JP610]